MSRWKVLPHRLADGARRGQCRDCGRYELVTAPDTCPRCALQRYADRGCAIIVNPVEAFEQDDRELWRGVARAMRSGQIGPNRFYIWIGHGDGGPLERAPDEVLPEREFAHASRAHKAAREVNWRYPQVWVITTVGGWNISNDLR